MNRPRVLIADDNKPLVVRVAELLASSFDVVGFAHDGQDLISKTLHLTPEVIIVDISMPSLEEGALGGFVVKPYMKDDPIPAINSAMAGKLFVSAALSTSHLSNT
jgi:CheY-like chemotaxis protein